jgi:ankyrin repeat protein
MWAAEDGHVDVVKALLAAGAAPNLKAHVTTLTKREHADHPSGGFTAAMFAARNGHEEVLRALVAGGADLRLTNGDGATATIIAIVNDRFDLAAKMLDMGADANDGSLYYAVDMHDATTDMRARDGSRLRADHPNQLTAFDLVKLLLERGADPNKPFAGQIHNTTLCCSDEHNASPFFRAAIAADVEVLKLMIKHGAQLEWSPAEKKKEGEGAGPGRGANANVGKTPAMMAMAGGRGAPFAAGPGFERLIAPPYREPANRDPGDALKVLLDAGANPNAKSPDGATLLHQAVTARRTDIIRALVAAGGKLDAVNKDNLTPLLLAEKPEPPPPPGNNTDSRTWRPRRDSREQVIATLRELMHLGPNDPAPVPPPLAEAQKSPETK